MNWSEVWRTGILTGVLAGIAGGLVLGITMAKLGMLPAMGQVVRVDTALVGFLLLLVVAAATGAGFGLLVWYQRPGAGETLVWGLVYGTFWWYLGPLTLLPLLRGHGLTWDVNSALAAFPVLLGLVLYGATTGLVLVLLQWRRHSSIVTRHFGTGTLVRGGLAGLLAAGLLGAALNSQGQLLATTAPSSGGSPLVAWLVTLVIGLLAGGGFALLYSNPPDGAGAGLIRGTAYGFFWWVVGPLTLVPLLGGASLTWSVEGVQSVFAALPGYLLFGAAVALFYQWLGALGRFLFSDFVPGGDEEGVGTRGLRIVGRSVLAGLVGGLLFSLVMLQIGFLPAVGQPDRNHFARGRLLCAFRNRGTCWNRLWSAVPPAEFRPRLRPGLGVVLWVFLGDPRTSHPDADLPWWNAPVERGSGGSDLSQPDRSPGVRGRPGNSLLPPGGSLQPVVDTTEAGGVRTYDPPKGAGVNLGPGPMDPFNGYRFDAAGLARRLGVDHHGQCALGW